MDLYEELNQMIVKNRPAQYLRTDIHAARPNAERNRFREIDDDEVAEFLSGTSPSW